MNRIFGCCIALAMSMWLHPRPVCAQTSGLSIQMTGGQANLSVTGAVNGRYIVQCSTNLSQPGSWQPFTNVLLPSSPYLLSDSGASTAAQKFFRVISTGPVVTVTDAQVEDMCQRMCAYLNSNTTIPETILISTSATNALSAADFYYIMVKWLGYYKDHGNTAPATVTIASGTLGPVAPVGIESGQIYLADILSSSKIDTGVIDIGGNLPNCTSVAGIQYTTKAMLWLYARTIKWYQDNAHVMPVYATVKPDTAPPSWALVPPSGGLRVGIFSDPNGSTMASCVQASLSILSTNSGFSPTTLSPAQIQGGALTNFDVLMLPGGSGSGQATALGQNGCAQVAQFVANGGGLIGTCAGSYLPVLGYNINGNTNTYWLELVNADVIDVDHWNRGVGDVQIQIVNSDNVILAGFASPFAAHYENGPLLEPGDSTILPPYEQEAVFASDLHDNGAPAGEMPGATAMTTSSYQLGRVVLFGFHPELTPGLELMETRAVRWAAGKL